MAYVDYSYYKDSFGGKTIPEASFNSYERKARVFIDHITFSRLREDESLIDTDVKECLCEVAECALKLENEGGIKVSESVESHSVTYAVNPSTTEYSKYYSIAKMYLGHTGLLYRGV